MDCVYLKANGRILREIVSLREKLRERNWENLGRWASLILLRRRMRCDVNGPDTL